LQLFIGRQFPCPARYDGGSFRGRYQDKGNQKVFPFEQKEINHTMPYLLKQAGGKQFGFHASSHLATSTLLAGAMSKKVPESFLGHKRLTTTKIYIHTIGRALKGASENPISQKAHTEGTRNSEIKKTGAGWPHVST
jgi:integrase